MDKFEYRVCQIQLNRVTFVNGQWQGTKDYDVDDYDTVSKSCPEVWDYLSLAGDEGWELVTTSSNTIIQDNQYSQVVTNIFLKRIKGEDFYRPSR